jgi:hypothetical protein
MNYLLLNDKRIHHIYIFFTFYFDLTISKAYGVVSAVNPIFNILILRFYVFVLRKNFLNILFLILIQVGNLLIIIIL